MPVMEIVEGRPEDRSRDDRRGGGFSIFHCLTDAIYFYYFATMALQLIFTDEVVAKYNGLFSFLFRVNRVQYALGQAWAEQMQHQKTMRKGNSKMAVATRMMNLRANMSFLVDNIQQYLKVRNYSCHEILGPRDDVLQGP